ncbi:MAG: hypothetical protein NTW96_27505 [Planctomycetia bacterium]|nr:hypothetical protein [Planctomycetia bacterium]
MAAFDLTAYMKQLQAAQDKANAANEKRYQDAIAEMRSGQGKIAGQFDAARTDVNMGATQAGATANQSLMSAGLGNTTIVQGAARGIEADRQRALTNIAGQQGTAEAGYSRDIANLMGQKNETGPDLSMYAGLLAQAASNPLNGYQGTGKIYNSSNGGGISNARVAGGGASAFGGGLSMGGSSGNNFAGAAGTYSGPKGGAASSISTTTPAPTPIASAAAVGGDTGGGTMSIVDKQAQQQTFTPYMGFSCKWIYTPEQAARDDQYRQRAAAAQNVRTSGSRGV